MEIRSPGNRLRYFINDLLIRNTLIQMLYLFAISAVVIAMGMLLINNMTGEGFWWSFTRFMDQGTFIEDNANFRPAVAAVGVVVTIGGIMILSLLIGVFSSKIADQLDSLKRGKSPIVEKNHFIVCGDGDRLFEVTRELVGARMEKSARGSIVMFSSRSREDMEEILVQRLGRRLARQVICRSGDPADVDSLSLPGFSTCSGFVIIGDDDSVVLKTLIAARSMKERRSPVAVCELRNTDRGRIAEMAYEGVHWIPVREIVMRLLVQIGRQPGLSLVYNEILSFQENEFYLKNCPEVDGLSFREISGRIFGGIAAGILQNGKLVLNPPPDMRTVPGDSLLVLSQNRNDFSFPEASFSEDQCAHNVSGTPEEPMKMLVLSGSSRNINFMIKKLDEYSLPGSEIVVAGSIPEEEGSALLKKVKSVNCTAVYMRMDRTDPDSIEMLHPREYHSIMVISGKGPGMSDEDADSQCIVTLLILRDIAVRCGNSWRPTVVSEIRNPRNRRLATAAGIDDFVISNEVCSMIMAQLVIQPELSRVYAEIFDPYGCEVQLRKASLYKCRKFADVAAEGMSRGEVVLGWLTGTGLEAKVSLNPAKDALLPEELHTRVIVIAER